MRLGCEPRHVDGADWDVREGQGDCSKPARRNPATFRPVDEQDAKAPAANEGPQSDEAPKGAVDTAAAIKRPASLSRIKYDGCRQAEAERLGARVSTLDAEVARLRQQSETGAEAGTAVPLDELKPWPDTVDGAALLDALVETFARYLALPAGAPDALALWAMHTHVYDAFEHTPRLNITAPGQRLR